MAKIHDQVVIDLFLSFPPVREWRGRPLREWRVWSVWMVVAGEVCFSLLIVQWAYGRASTIPIDEAPRREWISAHPDRNIASYEVRPAATSYGVTIKSFRGYAQCAGIRG